MNALAEIAQPAEYLGVPSVDKYVIDGGWLLQQIPWRKGCKYEEICEDYVNFLERNFKKERCVVFDGYPDFTTKDSTHIRRTKGKLNRVIKPELHNILSVKKDDFLLNKYNKQCFIFLLGNLLKLRGFEVHHADDDADTSIVAAALEKATTSSVALVADDTDILVLLLHKADMNLHPLYLASKKTKRIWNIVEAKEKIGPNICNALLSIHSISGCDTTSRIHSVSKSLIFKKCLKDNELLEKMIRFSNAGSKDDVVKIGLNILLKLFNAKHEKSLNELRAKKYLEKLSGLSKNAIKPEILGPTQDAAELHLFRCYYQIQIWKEESSIDPLLWGWKKHNGKIMPIEMRDPIAPPELLKVIRCKCKTDCSNNQCSCRRFNVFCTNMCGECKGVSCFNSEQLTDEETI